jgi:sugar/nucleoside kinase (ribokinase family)
MTLTDAEGALRLYHHVQNAVECCGGSAANSMVGLAAMGGRASYIGRVRDDQLGALFGRDMRAAGVAYSTPAAASGPATARCLVFVTPDAQRTMLTFLGASADLGPQDVDPDRIGEAAITFLEGYLWDPLPAKEAFLKAARLAHDAGRMVSLTLSDPFCVDRHRVSFLDLVHHHVDILFANEQEITSLYETDSFESAITAVQGRCRWAAVTRGAKGAVVLHADEAPVEVPAEPLARVVDTTGAGDQFAAGFLYGICRGASPAACGRLGVIAAAEVIEHFGARPVLDLKPTIHEVLHGGAS